MNLFLIIKNLIHFVELPVNERKKLFIFLIFENYNFYLNFKFFLLNFNFFFLNKIIVIFLKKLFVLFLDCSSYIISNAHFVLVEATTNTNNKKEEECSSFFLSSKEIMIFENYKAF